jgi:transcriptional regulator with XRE-family HTH domain
MTICDKIRKIRVDNGLSQQNVADEIKVKHSTYNKIENGKAQLKYDTLVSIASVYKIHVIELITYGETIEELDFFKEKIQLTETISANAVQEMADWRRQAKYMLEENVKLKEEILRLKKTSKLYSTEEESHLSMVAEAKPKRK